METGTLKELNVKPRDVVEFVAGSEGFEEYTRKYVGTHSTVNHYGTDVHDDGSQGWSIDSHHIFRIVSRASDTPPTWGEMTDAERREISFAAMSGKTIELLAACAGQVRWLAWDGKTPLHLVHQRIRIRPEPVRETVTREYSVSTNGISCISVPTTHRITFDTIDGKPDCASVKMEELK